MILHRVLLFSALPHLLLLTACSGKRSETSTQVERASSTAATQAQDFSSRIGIAVTTTSRSCIAIHNPDLIAGTAVTLVAPAIPQSFAQVEISGSSDSYCPVTQEVEPGISSYDLKNVAKSMPKLTPFIAVLRPASDFTMNNIQVQADLNSDRVPETFRACQANQTIHLSIWNGLPLQGKALWHGAYYEPSNLGSAPVCSDGEFQ